MSPVRREYDLCQKKDCYLLFGYAMFECASCHTTLIFQVQKLIIIQYGNGAAGNLYELILFEIA